ncbi:MAG: branched-chain amino acid ABC transporter permease [Lachnospiraceae bacterium]|nr:branched-chain amino acid ABC transporter permease [Lachnospiraceae bacterium]
MKNIKINKKTKQMLITLAIVVIFYAFIEILSLAGALSGLFSGLLVPMTVYILAAIGLNLCVGYLGELSLGHAGFMCVGAYSSSLFSMIFKDAIPDALRFLLALAVGGIVAMIFGFLIAIPVLRLKGDYLAIVTLAFGEIIKNIINTLFIGRDADGFHFSMKDTASLNMAADGEVILNGPQGITGTPKQATFTIGILLIILCLVIVYNFVNSRTGRAVTAIRDNRIAAETIGINITKYKIIAFTLSAGIAGLGGVLYAHNLNSLTATTKNFGYNMSIMLLVYVVLGGIGSLRGTIIATVILYALPELLRGLADYRMLIYSIVLIALMIFNWAPGVKTWREVHGLDGASLQKKLKFGKKEKEVQ